MDFDLNIQDDQWELSLDIDDSDLRLTQNPVRIISGPTAMKDISGTIPGTIHYKVIDEGGYRKDIIVGAALILANVSVFSPKPSMHYLNTTKRNVVKVFRRDTVPESGNGSG
ncbi:GPCR kinase [Tanacetum coccineum]